MALAALIVQELFYSKYLLPVYVVAGGLVFFLALRPLHAIDREDLALLSDFFGPRLAFFVRWAKKLLGVETSNTC